VARGVEGVYPLLGAGAADGALDGRGVDGVYAERGGWGCAGRTFGGGS
jgi:hypothetical protein